MVVRVRKVVVEEEVTLTVRLRREELRIEHLPIRPDMTESELTQLGSRSTGAGAVEVVLRAEEPVVSTRVVPTERVRVTKALVTHDRQLTDVVRSERVTVDEQAVGS